MIPHRNDHAFSSSGLPNVVQQFTISPEHMAKIANTLASGLYSDKPTAVQRELTANAYDSHVSAGVAEPPIIHMCTVLEPWWSIQDFGTGLDHDEMLNLFASFGGSTKRDDNKVVGNKGYGSKSYFAYTDAASITAIKDGVRREYSAFRDGNGMPSITLISEQPTNGRNGLLVSFGVLEDDVYAFQDAGKQVYRRYDPHPVIEGMDDFVPEPYETVMEGQGWVFRKESDEGYYRAPAITKTPYAIQGNIAYPISMSSIRRTLPEDLHFMGELPFDIVFPIGELETADSREALQYNERTVAAIVDKLTEMHTEIANTILPQIFAGCTTKWEAVQKLSTFIGDIENRKYKKLIKETAKWNGVTVDDVLDVHWQVYRDGENQLGRYPRLYEITERRFSFQTLNMSTDEVSNYGDTSLYGKNEYIVLVSDETEKRLPSRLKTYMFNTYGEAKRGHRWDSKNQTYPVVIFFKGDAASIKTFIPHLEGHPWHKFDDFIPEYPTVRRARGTSPAVTGVVNRRVMVYNQRGKGWNNNENRQQWDDVTVDTNTQTTGVYVNLRKWMVHSDSDYVGHWETERIRSLAIAFNLMLPTDKIYGVPGGQKNELAPLAGWHDLTALIDSIQTKWEMSKGAPSEVTYNQVHSNMKRIAEMSDYFKKHSIMDRGVIKTFLKRVPIDSSDKIRYHINLANNKVGGVGINQIRDLFDQSLADKITGEYDAVNTQYPMLAYLSFGEHEVTDLKNYIDLVERTKPFFVPRSNKPTLT